MTFHTGVRMVSRRWVLAAVLAIAVGCSSPSEVEPIGGDEPATSEPTAEPTEEPDDDGDEPEPPVDDEDEWAVPDEIDEDYVESVLNEILARDSQLVLEILESELEPTGFPSEEQVERLAALYGGPAGREEAVNLPRLVSEQGFRDAQVPPEEYGTQRFDVKRLHAVEPGCVTVLGWLDLTETAVAPYDPDVHGAVVIAYDDDLDAELNPTGWRIWDRLLLTADGEPVPIDDITTESLEPHLDLECEER